jgi:hypothetical protein
MCDSTCPSWPPTPCSCSWEIALLSRAGGVSTRASWASSLCHGGAVREKGALKRIFGIGPEDSGVASHSVRPASSLSPHVCAALWLYCTLVSGRWCFMTCAPVCCPITAAATATGVPESALIYPTSSFIMGWISMTALFLLYTAGVPPPAGHPQRAASYYSVMAPLPAS